MGQQGTGDDADNRGGQGGGHWTHLGSSVEEVLGSRGRERHGWGRKTETERHRRDRSRKRWTLPEKGDRLRRRKRHRRRVKGAHTDPEAPADPQRCRAEGAVVPPAPCARRVAPESRALCPPPARQTLLQPGKSVSRAASACGSPTSQCPPPLSGRPRAPG